METEKGGKEGNKNVHVAAKSRKVVHEVFQNMLVELCKCQQTMRCSGVLLGTWKGEMDFSKTIRRAQSSR